MKTARFKNYTDFWNWFGKNEERFREVVKGRGNVEKEFFEKLAPKLAELKDGCYFLTGMTDPDTVELILTADGNIKDISFVEELVNRAPHINGWKFTALKPPMEADQVGIEMDGYRFDKDNLFFYANELNNYPDEIDISIVHNELTDQNREQIYTGTFIFLDNYLGELDFLNNIDNLNVIRRQDAEKDLIPIIKLKEFLVWRRKEFVEKYEGVQFVEEKDEGSLFEAISETGNPLTAVMNLRMLEWEGKVSHPWIALMTIKYTGGPDGLPIGRDYDKLDEIEANLTRKMKNVDGYLFIGRQIGDDAMEVYFGCRDFRKPSRVLYRTQQQYKDKFDIDYDIYKDKYWRSFERFRVQM